jgi:hypothetical protein
MKIKELIQTEPLLKEVCDKPPVLQSNDSIQQAFRKFTKYKVDHLEVYEDGVLLGIIPLIAFTASLMDDYQKEREKRYQLINGLNHSLTKLKNLIKKINSTKTPVTKRDLIDECESVIDSALYFLK